MKFPEDGLKQRIIGAMVLLALAVIFVPVLFDRESLEPIDTETMIPPEPQVQPVVVEPVQAPPVASPAPDPAEMFVVDEDDAALSEPQARGLTPEGEVKSWVLQVASFREEDHAAAMQKRLGDAGFSAFSRESKYKNGSVTRVYVGPKLDKSELNRIKAQVDRQFDVKSMLLEFRPI